MPSVCLMRMGLTTGRETEAGWGGGRGLGPLAPVSRVSGGFHFIVPPTPVELEVKRQGWACPWGLAGVRLNPGALSRSLIVGTVVSHSPLWWRGLNREDMRRAGWAEEGSLERQAYSCSEKELWVEGRVGHDQGWASPAPAWLESRVRSESLEGRKENFSRVGI